MKQISDESKLDAAKQYNFKFKILNRKRRKYFLLKLNMSTFV